MYPENVSETRTRKNVLESSSPFPHALFHSLHVEDAEGKTFADKFRRYILVVFVKDGNLFGLDEFKRIEVCIRLFF